MAEHRQTTGDKGLVLHRVQTRLDTQSGGEFFSPGTQGIDKDFRFILNILLLVILHQGKIMAVDPGHVNQTGIFFHLPAVVDSNAADQVNYPARRCLPAITCDKGGKVVIHAGIDPRRDLTGKIRGLDHDGVRPRHRLFQSPVHRLIVGERNIEDRPVIDVVDFLQILEYLVVMRGNIRKFGEGEIGTAAGNVAPGGSAPVVEENRFHPGFCQVTEEGASPDPASGYQRLHFHFFRPVAVPAGDHLLVHLARVEFAHSHLVRQGTARGRFAHDRNP